MGLDMFAFTVPAVWADNAQVDVKLPDGMEQIAYWRKFNHLHGWMHRLYVSKGGKSQEFNCNTVRLMPADLDRLLLDAKAGLPHTPGFFFGDDTLYDSDRESINEFVAKARAAIREGKAVFYDSWW